jgi:hypothetical protein
MAASSAATPSGRIALRPNKTTGRKERIGTLCSTSSNGINTLSARRL